MIGSTGDLFLLLCIVFRETRHGVLLHRCAERLRKEPGKMNLDMLEEMRIKSMRQLLMGISCTTFPLPVHRAGHYLLSAYNGYLFGLTFLSWVLRWYLGTWGTDSIRSR